MSVSSWSQDLIARYESGASNQFLLYGNVEDEFLLQGGSAGTIRDFLLQNLLASFDVCAVLRFGKRFAR